ncbi:MAG: hypothetical protein JXA18_17530 [Chitinispirillaceae bacterium]|nr:hypothetical protein [Chitinispirillaceae bacterium]
MKTVYKGILLLVGFTLFLLQCVLSPEQAGNGSGVGTGMVTGMLYEPDGKTPARGALVEVRYKDATATISSGAVSKVLGALLSTTTDDNGNFSFDTIPAGLYIIEGTDDETNMVLFDSIKVTAPEEPLDLPADTLLPAGAIKGSVQLVNGGNPQQVFVLAFGVDRFSQADAEGRFLFTPFARGTYTLRVLSLDPEYGFIDIGGVVVRSGDTIDIGTIELPSRQMPAPVLHAEYDTLQMRTTLWWHPTPSSITRGYNVYCIGLDTSILNYIIQSLRFDLDHPLNGAYLYQDTVFFHGPLTPIYYSEYYGGEYCVAAVDSFGNQGPLSNPITVIFYSYFDVFDTITLETFPYQILPYSDAFATYYENLHLDINMNDEMVLLGDTWGDSTVINTYALDGRLVASWPVPVFYDNAQIIGPVANAFDTAGNYRFMIQSHDSIFLGTVLPTGEFLDPIQIRGIEEYYVMGNGGGRTSVIAHEALYFIAPDGSAVFRYDLRTSSLSLLKSWDSGDTALLPTILYDDRNGIILQITTKPSVNNRYYCYWSGVSLDPLFTLIQTECMLLAARDSVFLGEQRFFRKSASGELLSGVMVPCLKGLTGILSDRTIVTEYQPGVYLRCRLRK